MNRVSAGVRAIAVVALSCFLSASFAAARDLAPPFSLQLMPSDGSVTPDKSVSLHDYRDSVVLVNFWASWCAPCVHELPSMQALRDKLRGQPFEILALNLGEEPAQIQSFLDGFETRLEFPILLRADFWVADDFGVRTMPTSVLIDKQGKVVDYIVGARQWDSPEVENLILALTAE